MNANELADELEIAQGNNNADELIPKAIAMLRQQQANLVSDVEVIERQYKEIQVKDEAIFNSQKQAYNLAMQVQNQKFEIEALKAHPVNPYQSITDTKIEPTVVSYTHPVELTDEEILAISNENYIENKGGDIDFARAILRKAQDHVK
jgi:hypothetical protein